MKLTKKQKSQATEKLLDLLDGAYRCPPKRGLETWRMVAAFDDAYAADELGFTLDPGQVRKLLRASGKATWMERYPGTGYWRLSAEEITARFTYKGKGDEEAKAG